MLETLYYTIIVCVYAHITPPFSCTQTKRMALTKINIRLDIDRLDDIAKRLGVDRSKAIRACMNCTLNVLLNTFGGEVGNIFRRKRNNEELDLYENP